MIQKCNGLLAGRGIEIKQGLQILINTTLFVPQRTCALQTFIIHFNIDEVIITTLSRKSSVFTTHSLLEGAIKHARIGTSGKRNRMGRHFLVQLAQEISPMHSCENLTCGRVEVAGVLCVEMERY